MLLEPVGKLLDPLLPVGEDNALGDDHVLVELKEGSELLAVFLEGNVELLDSFQSELLILDQNLDRSLHELLSHFNNFWRHGGREEADLDVSREVLENLFDFFNKASAEHLVGLIEHDDSEEVSPEGFLLDEILYPSGGANNNMDAAILKGLPVFPGVSSSNATPGVDFDEFTEAEDDLVDLLGEFPGGGEHDGLALGRLGVNQLEQADGKGRCFAGT